MQFVESVLKSIIVSDLGTRAAWLAMRICFVFLPLPMCALLPVLLRNLNRLVNVKEGKN